MILSAQTLAPPAETQAAILKLRDKVKGFEVVCVRATKEDLLRLLNTALYLPEDMDDYLRPIPKEGDAS